MELRYAPSSSVGLVARLLVRHGGLGPAQVKLVPLPDTKAAGNDALSGAEAAVRERMACPTLLTSEGEVLTEPFAVCEALCTRHLALEELWPDVADPHHDAYVKRLHKTFAYCTSSLATRVEHAVRGENEDLLGIALDMVCDAYVGPGGFVLGDALSAGDLVVLAAVRPWTLLDGAQPEPLLSLERAAERHIRGWHAVLEPWDRQALTLTESSEDAAALPAGHSAVWATHVGRERPVQPRDVVRLAENFGVDARREVTLLWLVRQALETPLPPHWRVVGHRAGNSAAVRGNRPSEVGAGGAADPLGAKRMLRSQSLHVSKSASRGGSGALRTASSFHPSAGGGLQSGMRGGGGRGDAGAGATAAAAEEKGVRFMNQLNGESTFIHPGAGYLESQLEETRRFAASIGVTLGLPAAVPPSAGAWMQFKSLSSDDGEGKSRPAGAAVAILEEEDDAESKRSTSRPTSASGEGKGDEGALKMSMGTLGTEMGMPELSRPTTRADTADSADAGMTTRQRLEAASKAAEVPEVDPDAGYFYHCFMTGKNSAKLPEGARIVPQPASPDEEPDTLVAQTDEALGETLDRTRAPAGPASTSGRVTTRGKGKGISTLHFKSWWNEGNALPFENVNVRGVSSSSMTKHVINIFFDIDTGACKVAMQGDDKVYNLSHLNGKDGALECWDMFVNARVEILGRVVSLMQASSATQNWIDHHAIRLRKVVNKFEKELVKYDRQGASEMMRKKKQREQRGGKFNLRAELDLLDTLRRHLAKYRPKLAHAITQSMSGKGKASKK